MTDEISHVHESRGECDLRVWEGERLAARGQIEGAIARLHRAIELEPECAYAFYRLGFVLLRAKRPAEAVGAFARSEQLGPDHWVTIYDLGKALQQVGRHEEAIDAFSRAIALNPNGPSPLVQRAESHAALGSIEAAIADLEAALRLEPNAKRWRSVLDALFQKRQTPG